MPEQHVDVIIIGGGQAGLALSYYLSAQGCPHIVLEQARVGESWRSKRWDSFHLVSPNWLLQLPGSAYDGDDPDGFMAKDDVVAFIDRYAAQIDAPLRCGTRVAAVVQHPAGQGFLVRTDDMTYQAAQIVVATGAYQRPSIPAFSAALPAQVVQLTPNEYQRPDQLPPGAVLVVGSGESGCQIAEELRHSGRAVFLAVGESWWVPRRYRGRDFVTWAAALGSFEQTVDTLPHGHARFAPPGPQLTGSGGGRTLNLHTLARDGVQLLGRLQNARGDTLLFAPDLAENTAKADQQARDFMAAVDEYVQTHGLAAPEDAAPAYSPLVVTAVHELSLSAANVTSMIWATGYRPDMRWVELPAFDEDGYPVHQRGVSAVPGLYFLGLEWLHTSASGLFHGVGPDAEFLAGVITKRRTSLTPSLRRLPSPSWERDRG